MNEKCTVHCLILLDLGLAGGPGKLRFVSKFKEKIIDAVSSKNANHDYFKTLEKNPQ